MHDALFANQSGLKDPAIFERLATNVGLDAGQFDACLDRDPSVLDFLKERRLPPSISATPAFVFGTAAGSVMKVTSILQGVKPLAAFEEAIDQAVR